MSRDPLLWRRNAFVLPGGLLVAYSILGMAYGLWLRVPRAGCAQGEVVVGGCQNIGVVLLPVLVIGIALVAFGLLRYRARPVDLEGHLHHGTGTHFTLVLLASLVLVGLVGWVWAAMRQASMDAGQYLAVEAGGVEYEFSFVMRLLLLVALIALVAAGGMYLTQGRLRTSFLEAAQAPELYVDPYVEAGPEPESYLTGSIQQSGWTAEPVDEPADEPAYEPVDRSDAEE